ncbi:hypothetical protein [Mycobacterium dioxanotrophicus]|uniref:hypothetical protein n=1 Tax=Mycobacterium dioxanotrophicus TaxID=482462 RepID=UPI0012FBE48F|nr:hypothetical protein [Mycobacterium dioxanotrophicus]
MDYPCPQCGRARVIPSGSNTPRCYECEPVELWIDAANAYLAHHPEAEGGS